MRRAFLSGMIIATFAMTMVFAVMVNAQTMEDKVAGLNIQSIQEVTGEQVETFKKLIDMIVEFFVKYSFQVLGGFIVLFLGWMIGGFIGKKVFNLMTKKNVDITISKFTASCVKLLVLIFAVIVALGKFGIEIAPLIAGISVAGVGISFALQGTLSNYAAGLALIFTKPFKVGDIVELVGQVGEVVEIKLPRTELKTVDGTKIMIPNNKIVGEIMENFSDWKKVILDIGVGYRADVDQAIEIVKSEVTKDGRVKDGQAHVGIIGFGDSSVDLKAIFFCKQDDYWQIQFDMNKNIFDALKKAKIEIPFPQRDVHLFKQDA